MTVNPAKSQGTKSISHMLKMLIFDFAQDQAQLEQLRSLISAEPDPRVRAGLRRRIENRLNGTPPTRKPHANWTSMQWLSEAEHQKCAARKYQAGGYLQHADECQKEAQIAEQTGMALRLKERQDDLLRDAALSRLKKTAPKGRKRRRSCAPQ
jgi:hypothetical protein